MPSKKKKKKKEVSWRRSEGRKLLYDDVRSGAIAEDMEWEDAFEQRPEFDVGVTWEEAKRLFKGRLSRARKRIKDNNTRAETELALMQQDLSARPRPATNHRGEPRWEGSSAQKYLKKDIADKKHERMSLSTFHESRPEYQLYPKRVIAGKIEQEIRLVKFLKQYSERRGGF